MYQHSHVAESANESPRHPPSRLDRCLPQLSTLVLFLVFAGFIGVSWYSESRATNECEASCERLAAFAGRAHARINALTITEDGMLVASGQGNGQIAVWNRSHDRGIEYFKNQSCVRSLAFAPGGDLLAAAGGDRASQCSELCIWHVASGVLVAQPATRSGMIHALAWSADGRFLAAATEDGGVQVWETADWRLVAEPKVGSSWACALLFAPLDGSLVIASGDGRISQHVIPFGRMKESWQAHPGSIRSLSYAPNGAQLATAGDDGVIRTWTPSGQPVREIRGVEGLCRSILFANEGRELVVSAGFAGMSTRLRRWRLADGVELPALTDPIRQVPVLALDGRGTLLASGGADSKIRLWCLHEARMLDVRTLRSADGP